MDRTITATELAEHLSEILSRVRDRGERFLVERDGETVATIGPVSPARITTWGEVVARLGDLEPPGEGFADDFEAIQASQPPAEIREWPD
jgi:antitoxin (DNA-binding transcriptional repressor) of toxin-antitoxin stability system